MQKDRRTLKKALDEVQWSVKMRASIHGAIAQLGERLHGMQEVRGSIPRSSTNKIKGLDFHSLAPFFVSIFCPTFCPIENVVDLPIRL